jgi:hypothetical protein
MAHIKKVASTGSAPSVLLDMYGERGALVCTSILEGVNAPEDSAKIQRVSDSTGPKA